MFTLRENTPMALRTNALAVTGLTLLAVAGFDQTTSAIVTPSSRGTTANVAAKSVAKTTKPKTTKAPGAKSPTTTTAKKPTAWRSLEFSSKGLKEVSGCAVSRRSPNRVWVHNDSGDGPLVFPIDLSTGSVGQAVTLDGIDIEDPEDIAITSSGDLILADIGDNAVRRSSIQLYRFAEPAANATSVKPTRIDLRYPDGPHNAEALAVSADAESAFVITKEPSGVAGMYRADLTATSEQVLTLIGQITIKGESGYKPNLISAADAAGSTIILRTFQYGYMLDVPAGAKMADAVRATPWRFNVPQMAQGEALCVGPDGVTLVTASESQGASTFAVAVGTVPR